MPLLVQNEAGYRNLTKLLSAAYLKAEPGDWPHVKKAMLAEHAEGLIALTGGPGGPINCCCWRVKAKPPRSCWMVWQGFFRAGSMSNCSATA